MASVRGAKQERSAQASRSSALRWPPADRQSPGSPLWLLVKSEAECCGNRRCPASCFHPSSRQESFTQRAIGHHADSKFLQRWQHFLLRLSPPQRVFALQCRHGLNGVRATDRLDARLGKSEVLYLALSNQILYRSRDLFYRDVRINTVLLEEVDGIDLKTLERGVCHFLDMLGSAIQTLP